MQDGTLAAHRAPWEEAGIPYGTCLCGCGAVTKLAARSRASAMLVRGLPQRYINHHNRRLGAVDYVEEDRGRTTPCWIWQRQRTSHGYGRLTRGGRYYHAHRWYYEQANGPIPEGLELDHLCRAPSCVNPDHLEPVTHAENCRRGKQAKLCHADALAIRFCRASTSLTQTEIGQIWGVSGRTVCSVLAGDNWWKPRAREPEWLDQVLWP